MFAKVSMVGNTGRNGRRYKRDAYVPAVETHRQTVVFQHPEHLPARWQHPLIVNVVGNRTAGSVLKADEVWRVGQDEINTRIRKAGHDLYAVSTHETGHNSAPHCQRAPLWCRDHHPAGRRAGQTGAGAQAARAAGAD